MLPFLICAALGGCVVPAALGLMDMGEAVYDALIGFRPALRKAAQGAILFALPALLCGAAGAWLWPGG